MITMDITTHARATPLSHSKMSPGHPPVRYQAYARAVDLALDQPNPQFQAPVEKRIAVSNRWGETVTIHFPRSQAELPNGRPPRPGTGTLAAALPDEVNTPLVDQIPQDRRTSPAPIG